MLSLRKDISICDAACVALALLLRVTLFTADSELVEKFPETTRNISSFELSEP
jgi:predicted nucleic acid-binding protein